LLLFTAVNFPSSVVAEDVTSIFLAGEFAVLQLLLTSNIEEDCGRGARRVAMNEITGNAVAGTIKATIRAEIFVWFVLALSIVLAGLVILERYTGYLLFHVLVEGVSIVIAFCALVVATVGWRSRSTPRDNFLAYIAIGIGWCAVLDVAHTLAFKGMGLLATDSANPATQYWIAARYLQALAMISAPIVMHWRIRLRNIHLGFGLATLAFFAMIIGGWFPVAFIDDQGLTPFKIYSEYLIILMLAATLALYFRDRARVERLDLLLLSASAVAMILAGFAFTLYVSVTATANMVGHLFKIAAYGFIFVALVYRRVSDPVDAVLRLEGGLEQSEERFKRAVNAANDDFWEWFPATGEAYLSPRWKQLLGYEDHELPNREESFFSRIHPDDNARIREVFRAHLEERKPYNIQLRLVCKNGEYRWFLARGTAEWDAQGRPTRMAGAMTDIHEHKQVEDLLVESEERFRQMFENNTSVLLLIEPESGQILDANAAAEKFYGYALDGLKSMRIDQINTLGVEETLAERHRAVDQKRNFFVFPHRLASGEIRTVEVHSSPATVRGQKLLFSIIKDVTELKRSEKALMEQSLALKARNAELTRFSEVAVNRELRMVELKQEINALCEQHGEAPRYAGAAATSDDAATK